MIFGNIGRRPSPKTAAQRLKSKPETRDQNWPATLTAKVALKKHSNIFPSTQEEETEKTRNCVSFLRPTLVRFYMPSLSRLEALHAVRVVRGRHREGPMAAGQPYLGTAVWRAASTASRFNMSMSELEITPFGGIYEENVWASERPRETHDLLDTALYALRSGLAFKFRYPSRSSYWTGTATEALRTRLVNVEKVYHDGFLGRGAGGRLRRYSFASIPEGEFAAVELTRESVANQPVLSFLVSAKPSTGASIHWSLDNLGDPLPVTSVRSGPGTWSFGRPKFVDLSAPRR